VFLDLVTGGKLVAEDVHSPVSLDGEL
jgi:hypothetical protein